MQVTSCPECETTFKISAEILAKADGRVRCGRCARIFDATVSLREQEEAETRTITPGDTESRWHFVDAGAAAENRAAARPELSPAAVSEPAAAAAAAAATAERAAAEAGPDASWLPALQARPRRRWPYVAAAVVLAGALAAQLAHEFRGRLAAMPGIGPALVRVYSLLGRELAPRIDLRQFELLDLAALTEPVTGAEGLLIIETRVRNAGPTTQAAPHIFVALLDRWQETIAGRYFAPQEYAVDPAADLSALPAGSTIDAQFVIVDPGPGATGFELQLCASLAHAFACDGAAVFD